MNFITRKALLLVLVIIPTNQLISKNINTFFIQPYPTTPLMNQEKMALALKRPGKLARKLLKSLLQTGTYQGVLATYMGYIEPSNLNGQIIFPRMHQAPKVNILITQMIEPVMMLGATVHHFTTLSTIPSQMYSMERKQDTQTGDFYWDVQQTEIPKNRRIALNTIVLFAKPKNIVVPTGITLTQDSPMLVLPDVYATKELSIPVNALRVLKIRNFFAPADKQYKKQNATDYAQQLL